ncbi:hypothetical protein [Halomicronema sp. CCY15110]|uniref:hypothetical protein n=1 Tax=Halomicronema sp. CCY15110 TaxID=2767773 RepID=UPI0019505C19|nr:hypothetical protein [Halomicronema sp. CCY15110]
MDETPQARQIQALKALFKETQALPQAQTLAEGDISSEIAAYRATQTDPTQTDSSR